MSIQKKYEVEVDCANCANMMEGAATKVSGVKSVAIDFMRLQMSVEFDESIKSDVEIKKVMKDVLKVCRKVERDCEIYF